MIGLSILSGSHGVLVRACCAASPPLGSPFPVVVGGIIPEADAAELRRAGVRRSLHAEDSTSPSEDEIVDVVEETHPAR